MALKEHMNNCARLAQPGIWIFRGKAMVFPVIGCALFILIMQCLRAVQLEMPIAIVISAVQARRADGPEEEVKGPKKLSRAQVGICIAGGGFAVLVLSLLGVLH